MKKMKVLFLCTGNSCRSQMAEGYLRHLGGEKFEVFSAGVRPGAVNPLAIRVMKEEGIDISGHRSKSVMEFGGVEFDHIVTVCDNARATCPVFPGKAVKIHWDIEDPVAAAGTEEERLDMFRKVRDKIKHRIGSFLGGL